MNTSLVRPTIDPSTSTGRNTYVLYVVRPTREKNSSFVSIVLPNLHLDSATTVSPQKTERMERTSSGPEVDVAAQLGQSSGEAVLEIRRRSGLTWEQLSELFNVSRRSIHYWANGRPLSTLHEKNIRYTLNAIRRLDTGNQRDTRSRLLSIDYGESIFNLLAKQRYEEVDRLVIGTVPTTTPRKGISLSKSELIRRHPPRPELLLDALHDRPKISPKKARTVKPMRRSRSRE